ncbi:MAG: hypothetical protein ACE37F_00815 [Nannocystaceae bacterium]|nr:hypothetical protein [bacterium]
MRTPAMRQMQFNLEIDDDTLFGPACAELAEALVKINMLELQATPSLPCCLGCGEVRYTLPVLCESTATMAAPASPEPVRRMAPVGFSSVRRKRASTTRAVTTRAATAGPAHSCQALLDARGIYTHKRGTCFDLACERAARLRLAGKDATVVIQQRTYGGEPLPGQFHAVVRTAEGIQDPAAELQQHPGQCSGSACSCTGGHG